MRSYWAVILGSALAVSGCAADKNHDGITDGTRDPTSVVLQAPSTPTGTISGQVLNTRLVPMSGVTVNLNAGGLVQNNGSSAADAGSGFAGLTTTTDSSGNFSFIGVPAGGDLLLSFIKDGYATARMTTVIPNSSGNQPMSNGNANVGPITLTETNATLKFLVVDHVGRPAKGAKATLEASPASTIISANSGAYGDGRGVVVADATADDSGILTFSGIPGPDELERLTTTTFKAYTVTVAALDANNDGIPESAGTIAQWAAKDLLVDTSMRVITLPDARVAGAVQLLTSNVGSFPRNSGGGALSAVVTDNTLKPGDPIYMVFNQMMLESSITVRITDESGRQVIQAAKTLTGGSVLTITPSAPLAPNKEYNISVHGISLDSGLAWDGLAWFFVADLGAAPTAIDVSDVSFHDSGGAAANGVLDNGEIVEITFNQPVGLDGSPNLKVFYFNHDMNGNTVADSPGEVGYTGDGFAIFPCEPNGLPDATSTTLPLIVKQSNYTTRYAFRFAPPVTTQVNVNTDVQLQFNRQVDQNGLLQGLWGQPVLTTVTKKLNITTAPFIPGYYPNSFTTCP